MVVLRASLSVFLEVWGSCILNIWNAFSKLSKLPSPGSPETLALLLHLVAPKDSPKSPHTSDYIWHNEYTLNLHKIFIKSYQPRPTTTFKILKFNPGSPLRLVCLYFHTIAQSASLCLSLLGHLLFTHNAFFPVILLSFYLSCFRRLLLFEFSSVIGFIVIEWTLRLNLYKQP